MNLTQLINEKTLIKASGSDINTGTDDSKFVTPKAIADSYIYQMYNGVGRQAIINGNFDVWQRGTSVALTDVTSIFQADRWFDFVNKDGGTLPTLTRSRQIHTSGDISNSFYFTRLTTNGAGTSLGVNSSHQYIQRIENGTRNLCGAGKTVTLTFWARSSIANKRICPTLQQEYGSGGSPTAVEPIKGTPITLTSTWTKYSHTFTTNTLVGKTFGTNNDDRLTVNIFSAWGTTIGDLYVQTGVTAETFVGAGNIDIAQVQLCAGDIALPFMPKSFEEELRACQRYYEKSWIYRTVPGTVTIAGIEVVAPATIPTNGMIKTVYYSVPKRIVVTPTIYPYVTSTNTGRISASNGVDLAAGTGTPISNAERCFTIYNAATQISESTGYIFHWTADAEL